MTTRLQLPASDAEINALVAEKVAGWTIGKESYFAPGGGMWARFVERGGSMVEIPFPIIVDYLNDANAVLALINSHPWTCQADCMEARVNIHQGGVLRTISASGYAPTFCRAACYALLRAAGVEIRGETTL